MKTNSQTKLQYTAKTFYQCQLFAYTYPIDFCYKETIK